MALGSEINGLALADFGESVDITLSGATVKTVTGILTFDPVIVSPGEMELVQTDAMLSVSESDMDGITSAHRFTVGGKIYRMQGRPRTQNGLTDILLSVQK